MNTFNKDDKTTKAFVSLTLAAMAVVVFLNLLVWGGIFYFVYWMLTSALY